QSAGLRSSCPSPGRRCLRSTSRVAGSEWSPLKACSIDGVQFADALGSSMTWQATVLTIFPEMFPGPLGSSLAGRALGEGKWALAAIDIRDFATDKHRSVDDSPA